MDMDEMILISVDDHVIEPAEMFLHHVPSKYLDSAPRVIRKEEGSDVWIYEGIEVPNLALNAVAGRPPEEYGFEPTAYEEIRQGCYDSSARVRDMDANGVLASMNFPSMAGFCGQLFGRAQDKDMALVMLRAYNDWHIDEWAGSHPGRFIPLALPGLWDPQVAADEVRRVAQKGCHAVTFSENPTKLGLPSFHSEDWDPFWRACCDESVVVTLHIGSSSTLALPSPDSPINTVLTLGAMNVQMTTADLIWSRVIRDFPELRFSLSEGGIGWIPYMLERLDYVYRHHKAWTGADLGGKLPSELFRERFNTCFIDDRVGVQLRDKIGLDTITWECDYPHSDSTWPHSPEVLYEYLVELDDDEINKITHRNAMRHYHFDPFLRRSPDECTVGALRARAGDVDVTTVPSARSRSKDVSSDGILSAMSALGNAGA
jgi:predicted TIM-barrel fold metal-dependent hydrolase